MQHETMTELRSICVYCGSGHGTDPEFREAAEQLGREMAREGVTLVYGGGNVGLMGVVARAVLDHGGHVVGVIPEFLKAREIMIPDAQELIVVPDMHTRKRIMFDRADAFVALPGGVGTLEELVEQLTWAQLGQHRKPILMANVRNFWKPLLVLLAHMRETGFIRQGAEVHYQVAEGVSDVIPMLRAASRRVQADKQAEALVEERF